MSECPHPTTEWVGDMPMVDETGTEIAGHFDVRYCVDCHVILEKAPVGSQVSQTPQEQPQAEPTQDPSTQASAPEAAPTA
jgi:hypothetical protein